MGDGNISAPYRGGCLCGGVEYEVEAIELKMAHCHCSMCRKSSGAAFATFGEAKTENFRWLKGEELLKRYVALNGTTRTFCAVCGSSLLFSPSNDVGEVIEFTLGTLDSDIPHKPDIHVFTRNQASWFEITDQLPQFEKGRE